MLGAVPARALLAALDRCVLLLLMAGRWLRCASGPVVVRCPSIVTRLMSLESVPTVLMLCFC